MAFLNWLANAWNFIGRNWIGLVVGLGIVVVLYLIVLIASRQSMNGFIVFILALSLGLGGMFLENLFTGGDNQTAIDPLVVSGEVYIDPDSYLDYMITYTGGLYRDAIKAIESDPTTPVADDIYSNIKVIEYSDCVIFLTEKTRNETTCYMNVVFRKSNNGLDFVGCFNVYGVVNSNWGYSVQIKDLFSQITSSTNIYGLNKLTNVSKNPFYYTFVWEPYAKTFCNISGVDLRAIYCNGNQDYIHGLAQAYVKTILDDYFTNFDGVALAPVENELYLKTINDFYTTLFTVTKSSGISQSVFDWTPYSAQKIDDQFYKSNRFINVTLTQYENKAFDVSTNSDFVNNQTNYGVVGVTVDHEPVNYLLNITLSAGTISGLSDLDLVTTPILFTLTVGDEVRNIAIKSLPETGNVVYKTALPAGSCRFGIQSAFVRFYRSNTISELVFIISPAVNNLAVNYDYQSGLVETKFVLNPISNFVLTDFDITTQPVVLTLTRENYTVQYAFDTVEELQNGIAQYIQSASYSFTISSDGLYFSQTSGVLTVDLSHCVFTLNYDYVTAHEYAITLSGRSNLTYEDGRFPSVYIRLPNNYFGNLFEADDLTIQLFKADGSYITVAATDFIQNYNLTGMAQWLIPTSTLGYLSQYEGIQFIFSTSYGLIYTRVSNISILGAWQNLTLTIAAV